MIVEIANTPRDYAWGSLTAIARALGRRASGGPEAELWLGAHPGSPARIVNPELAGGATTLLEWIERDPLTTLGAQAAVSQVSASARGGDEATGEAAPRLPFLLKILAADQPLSLQAHPSPEKAVEGFARENLLGVPLDSAGRNYRDASHKPELIVALSSPFEALCGFRPLREVREIVRAFRAADEESAESAPGVFAELEVLLASDSGVRGSTTIDRDSSHAAGVGVDTADAHTLRTLVEWFLAPDGARIVPQLVTLAATVESRSTANEAVRSAANTVKLLDHFYPGDPGIGLSLVLNRVSLQAGQALYLPAGNIHAYLNGLGVELMASSDNVLRGGLTPKHVDVPELLSVLDFSPGPVPRLVPESPRDGVTIFRPDVPDFVLARLVCVTEGMVAGPQRLRGPAIAIATEGHGELRGRETSIPIARGQSFFVTPDEGELAFAGKGTVFVATVGE
jgi:mannose-6-phosphate isomerase